jgi:hypothetical protein
MAYMQRLMSLALTLAIIVAVPVFGQQEETADVSGSWSIAFDGPQGMVRMETMFAQEDTEITGTVSGPMGSGVELAGKIEGNSVAFEFSIEMAETSIRLIFTGKVSKDEESGGMTIAGMMDSGNGNFSTPFTANRKEG